MDPVFKKLQLKDQEVLLILNAPDSFAPNVASLEGRTVQTTLRGKQPCGLVLVFVTSCAEIGKLAPKVVKRLDDDGLLWFAYPKKSSKRYQSDIGRDDSWEALGTLGFEGVRQIAIDEDWSALRFRPVEKIKTLTRDPKRAMTQAGKARIRR